MDGPGGGLRLIFMGTPDFAVAVLDALVQAGHEIAGVYSQPPRRAGRGHKEHPSPVHDYAEARGLAVRTPVDLKDASVRREFAGIGADVAVVAAYGLILPQAILDAPLLGCLNAHASLLPRWRGAAPIQRAILAGDAETGITIMRMDAGLDTGGILLAEALPIAPGATAGALHDALAALAGRLMAEALGGLAAGKLASHPQPEEGVTYADKVGSDDARLDWARPAAELERVVRAFAPRPGAWFEVRGERIRVLESGIVEGPREAAPGTVLDDALTVSCGDGALRLVRVQRGGKAPMDAADFLRGYDIPAGTDLTPPADR
jgi:methionyl-tRNA formyltransferase